MAKGITVTVNFVEKGKYTIHTSRKYFYESGTHVIVTPVLPEEYYDYMNPEDKRIDLGTLISDKTVFVYIVPKKVYPWAVRLSSLWKSQTSSSNLIYVRFSRNSDMVRFGSDIFSASVGKEVKSDSMIRVNGKWVSQGKVGD